MNETKIIILNILWPVFTFSMGYILGVNIDRIEVARENILKRLTIRRKKRRHNEQRKQNR